MSDQFADTILFETLDAVKAMVHDGADVNAMDAYGCTPLIEAAIINDLPKAQFLLSAGADIAGRDARGFTALYWAVDNSNAQLAQLFP